VTSTAAPSTVAPPLVLSDAAVEHLGKARFWARFVSVFGFIYAGLMALAGVALVVFPLPAERQPVLLVLVAIVYALVGLLVLSSALFWTYAGRLAAFGRGQARALVTAFRSLRHIWIMLAISYGLSLLASAAMVLIKIVGVEVPGAGTPP
jgi:hypothetical protein